MNNKMIISAAALTAFAAGSAMATVYSDSATFLANINAGYYTNGFDDTVSGPSADLSYSDSGFSYTVSASGPGTNSLYNDPGLVSTDSAVDGILVTFTSGNVTAVGANMWATDISVFPILADVTVSLSDGTTETFSSSSPSDYRGFTSNVVITSLFIDADDSLANAWSTLDNLTVGVAPAPGAAALLGLGGLVATRRRR